MRNALELVSVCTRLNEANLFAVLLYARFKAVRQAMEPSRPVFIERRREIRARFDAHYIVRVG